MAEGGYDPTTEKDPLIPDTGNDDDDDDDDELWNKDLSKILVYPRDWFGCVFVVFLNVA